MYFPDTTICPQVSIDWIFFLGMNVFIAISLSVLSKYKPSFVKSNFIQFNIGLKFLFEMPLLRN